jgi:hypothetical protein
MKGQRISHIHGEGHGSAHAWREEGSAQVGGAPAALRRTDYRCADCGATFTHRYDCEPDIFRAMWRAGVPGVCAGPAPAEEAAPKAPVPAAVCEVLSLYIAGRVSTLDWSTLGRVAAYLETGTLHPELREACADFGYQLSEVAAMRAAGKTARELAAEIVARGPGKTARELAAEVAAQGDEAR